MSRLGTIWLAICFAIAVSIIVVWLGGPHVETPRQQQAEISNPKQQSDAQVCDVGRPVNGRPVLIGPDFIPIMKGPGRNTGRLVNQAGSEVLGRTVYVEVSGDEDFEGICETNDWIQVKVVGADGRKIYDGETGWIEKRYIVKELTPDRKLGLFWHTSKSDDIPAADRQWVRQGALKILAEEKKCTRVVFLGPGDSRGSYYVKCTDPAGKYFDIEFRKSDVASQSPIRAPAPPAPSVRFAELSSRELCDAAIKSHALHPSTVDIKTFTGYETRTYANGNRAIWQYFTAQNSFGLKLSYRARCLIEPSGKLEIVILEDK
jgi:hypothetical protein